jgi:hypothetical protein
MRAHTIRALPMPRIWIALMIVLIACLIASMVIAAIRLL